MVLSLLGSVPFRGGDLSRAGAMNVTVENKIRKNKGYCHHGDRRYCSMLILIADVYSDTVDRDFEFDEGSLLFLIRFRAPYM